MGRTQLIYTMRAAAKYHASMGVGPDIAGQACSLGNATGNPSVVPFPRTEKIPILRSS